MILLIHRADSRSEKLKLYLEKAPVLDASFV